MSKVFICYRREDSAYIAQQIYSELAKHFGSDSVVFDIDTIPLGLDFREYLNEQVSNCEVFLAIIGDQWLNILTQRLDEPNDFIRIEIQSALDKEIPVVPVLVGKALVPNEKDLPRELARISYQQAAEVRAGADLQIHLKRLINGLDHVLARRRAEAEAKGKAAFGEIGESTPLYTLIEAIKNPNYIIRGRAIEVLGKLDNEEAIPALVENLNDTNSDVRGYVAQILGNIGDSSAVPALIKTLEDENVFVRRQTTTALSKIRDLKTIPALVEILNDTKSDVRGYVAEILGNIGDSSAVPALIKSLKDEDAFVRKQAVSALDNIGDRMAIPAFKEALKDSDAYVRWRSAEALGENKKP